MVGVVSTSAMELGIDIGEIDIVVLLGVPPSAKAFWQRLGRAGQRNPGACLMIDDRGALGNSAAALEDYLHRALEPSWLYLENRYIQYAQALCAATEIAASPNAMDAFKSLPASFRAMLENEIHPTEIVPPDLYPLKQKAQGGPQLEFPIRTAVEQNFQVRTAQSTPLGTLTFSQALREAYPGGIYHYMAHPYRVFRFDYKSGEILARRERHWTTRPISQTMVFPRFQGGAYLLLRSPRGFLAEVEMQVSERIIGFTEQRGPNKKDHKCGPGSPYFQREITRFFATTGVCWYFGDKNIESEQVAGKLLEAFCAKFGVQERDLALVCSLQNKHRRFQALVMERVFLMRQMEASG
jgi:DEAD/DEAH box helicase domain-containing protein